MEDTTRDSASARPTSTYEGPGRPRSCRGGTNSLAPRPESRAGSHGLHGVPTAAPPGAAGNDMAGRSRVPGAPPAPHTQGEPRGEAPPNSSSVHLKDGGPLTAWMGCEAPPNSSSVHLKDGGPLTAWTGCEAPPNSSSVHPKDRGPSLPGQGTRCPQTPAVCIRKTGGPHCLDRV